MQTIMLAWVMLRTPCFGRDAVKKSDFVELYVEPGEGLVCSALLPGEARTMSRDPLGPASKTFGRMTRPTMAASCLRRSSKSCTGLED